MSSDGRLSTVERALQLARAGGCRSVDDIRRMLKSEGYDAVEANTSGAAVQAQLKAAMVRARG